MPAVLISGHVDWECPNCGYETQTGPFPPNAGKFHNCPRLHFLVAPLVRKGTRCKVWAMERQDYQGREITQDGDNGRPYMQVVTTREDGQDVAILAPCAQFYG
jgi:hypothetical protein